MPRTVDVRLFCLVVAFSIRTARVCIAVINSAKRPEPGDRLENGASCDVVAVVRGFPWACLGCV